MDVARAARDLDALQKRTALERRAADRALDAAVRLASDRGHGPARASVGQGSRHEPLAFQHMAVETLATLDDKRLAEIVEHYILLGR
jgi:hypothetical protein